MSALQLIAILMTLSAFAGYFNQRFLKLPTTIGMLAFSSLISFLFIVLAHFKIVRVDHLANVVSAINFEEFVLHGVLSILLFAGALHVNAQELKNQKYAIFGFATFGVLVAAVVTGYLLYVASSILGIDIPYIYCLIFGAIIVPTDPVSVLGILNTSMKNKALKAKIIGESLFNDGTGIVLFLVFIGIAFMADGNTHVLASPDAIPEGGIQIGQILTHLFKEIAGGVVLGLGLTFVTIYVIKSINNYQVEITITLALAFGSYALAEAMHVSAPIATVVAGLYMGNRGKNSMSDDTRVHLQQFWNLLDDITNSILFILIGLELVIITTTTSILILCVVGIFAVLVGRYLSLMATGFFLLPRGFNLRTTPLIMTWAGLRGGISIALAISLPVFPYKETILTITYAVVLFSVIVQGLTLRRTIIFFEKWEKRKGFAIVKDKTVNTEKTLTTKTHSDSTTK